MNIETSQKLFNRAKEVMPGGVNSPVRSFNGVGGSPIFFREAKGSILTDVDGNQYLDFVGSWGPMILGHANEQVIEDTKRTLAKSSSFGAPTLLEIELAELIVEIAPNVEKVRMVNSGTEACMSAIRLARGYTGKSKVIKFDGCYHGHADSFLIQAGSGAATLGLPNSPGVTSGTAQDTLSATFNDLHSVESLIAQNPNDIAAIIVEPVAGNMGCVPPIAGFLEGLRALCNKNNIILIFDEVMTGFRLSLGGAQELLSVDADLVTYGKIIGGGMPVGAYGGRREIMNMVAPSGPVYQAGTLSGNPVAMAAGLSTISILRNNPDIYTRLNRTNTYLLEQLKEVFKEHNFDTVVNQLGSMISLHFTGINIQNFDNAKNANIDLYRNFFHGMLNRGIYLPPSAFESWFLSTTISDQLVDQTVAAAREVAKQLSE